jgi:hypothetical protein
MSEAPAKKGVFSSWLEQGNHKELAFGAAAVLGFALYERSKTKTATPTPASATGGTRPAASGGNTILQRTVDTSISASQMHSLQSQLSQLSGAVDHLEKAPPGEVPLSGAKNYSLTPKEAKALESPIVSAIPAKTGSGVYYLKADGGVLHEGDAPFYGSARNKLGRHKAVAILPLEKGYAVVDDAGREFPFEPTAKKKANA